MDSFYLHSNSKDVVCCNWTKFFSDILGGAEETLDSPPFEPRQAQRTRFSILKCDAEEQAVNVQCKLQLRRLPDGSLLVDTVLVTGNCHISKYPEHQLKVFKLRDLKLLFCNLHFAAMHCEVK
ncbi:hypothetical protein TYRP_021911 [Tyrophagus putrescentiae]|nr:hypothetical protein TYRP_021911 [Tyrophagus putrescentiae]